MSRRRFCLYMCVRVCASELATLLVCVCLGCLFSTLTLFLLLLLRSFVRSFFFFQLLLLSLVAVALMLRRRRLSHSLFLPMFVCIPSTLFAVFFLFGICKLHKLSWTINYGKIIMDCCFGVSVCACLCVCVCECMQLLLLLLFLLAWLGSVLVLVDFFLLLRTQKPHKATTTATMCVLYALIEICI